MRIKKQIPNFFTCCNLICGVVGVVWVLEPSLVFERSLTRACYLIGIAAVFDFLDGFAARMLNVSSPVGKELDSLADMVTFGVLPGVLVYAVLKQMDNLPFSWLPWVGLLLVVFSALRLAKFNVDTRQNDSFIGLPTPACALFFGAYFLAPVGIDASVSGGSGLWEVMMNPWLVAGLSFVFSFLLVSNIRMFSLKVRSFDWASNKLRYSFLGIALLMITGGILMKNVFISIPIIILLYLLISISNNVLSNEIQSRN